MSYKLLSQRSLWPTSGQIPGDSWPTDEKEKMGTFGGTRALTDKLGTRRGTGKNALLLRNMPITVTSSA